MRIIITENKLVNMINSILGYNLSTKIEMITDYWEANVVIRYYFKDKERFDKLLNHWGPMFWIKTPENGNWLAQQREGREWFIYKDGNEINEYARRIDEHQLLSYMEIDMFGIPLSMIIDNFVEEE